MTHRISGAIRGLRATFGKRRRRKKRGLTLDNRITNRLVRQGKLPKSQLEVFPQRSKRRRKR